MAEAVSLYSGSLASSVSTELAVNYGDLDRVVILTLRSPFFDGFEQVKKIAEGLWPDSRFRSKSIKKETDRIGAFDGSSENGAVLTVISARKYYSRPGGILFPR